MTESYISPGVCPYAWSMAAVYAPPAPEPTAPSSLNITSDIPLNTTTSDILPSRTAPSTPGKTWVAPTAWLDFNKRPLEFEYTDEVWGICCPGEDFYFNESDGVCHKMRWRGSQSRNAVPMHVRWHPRTEAIATVSTHDNVAGGGIINAVRSVMYTTTEPAKAQATITGLSFVRMPLKDYSNYDWKSSRGTQSLTSRQIASIVGGAIGGTIFVTVIALACWLGRKKETKSAESVELVPQTVEECYQPTGWAGDAPPPYSASATEDEVPLKKDTDVRWAEIGSSSRP
ncbi:hypothetical protein BJ508DRAFT_419832 [Ascobolus immersus RN42]|uniref:Uncharacterized protein n=1 Tax=Ascobolus immersus RN42 TaxID=1160509 RepID=A0A3N4HB13_ASCIM|nr:hypothetical protein BJ508DRAFT_419832 [Ascobolus immersus RN42]